MNRLSKNYQLATAICAFVFPLFIFILEISSFNAYLKRPETDGAEAFGIIAVVAIALLFSIFIIASAILKLVSAIGLQRARSSAPQKRFRIVGIVGSFICVVTLCFFGFVFFHLYEGIYFSSILYFLLAGGELTFAAFECTRLKA